MSNIIKIKKELTSFSSTEKQIVFIRFFKTGKGQYGEGDRFIGITVPEVRRVAKSWYKKVTLNECVSILQSEIHEERLCALIMMVYKYEISDELEKKSILDNYLANTKYINNWDLVDLSCYKIVGEYFVTKNDYSQLVALAQSKDLWRKRIAMISTFAFLKNKDPKPTIEIANMLMRDKHDLIHKAVGWMLRETGKRVEEKYLTQYLDKNATRMPRTALRYAIERLSEEKRKFYLNTK